MPHSIAHLLLLAAVALSSVWTAAANSNCANPGKCAQSGKAACNNENKCCGSFSQYPVLCTFDACKNNAACCSLPSCASYSWCNNSPNCCVSAATCTSNSACKDNANCCQFASTNPKVCDFPACKDDSNCKGSGDDDDDDDDDDSSGGKFKDQNCCAMCSCDGSNCHNGDPKQGAKVFAKCGKQVNSQWTPVLLEYPSWPGGFYFADGSGITVQCQCTSDSKDYKLGEDKGNSGIYYCGTIPS